MSTYVRADTASSTTYDPNALAEEPTNGPSTTTSSSASHDHEHVTSHSGSFEWQESSPPKAPQITTIAPTIAPTIAATPTPSVIAIPTNNKSSGGGGSKTTVISITLVIVALLIALGIFLFVRRRRRDNRLIAAKFHHDPNLGTPNISIELPPPPPSSRLSYDPMAQSQVSQQRLSVFSNGRPGGGASIFNTAMPTVSPSRVQGSQAFRPDQSTSYRLFDPTPTTIATPILEQPSTPGLKVNTPTGRPQHQPDYGHLKPHYESKKSAPIGDKSTPTGSSSLLSQGNAKLPRDTAVSVASTIQGFHDSMCEDLYQYGDGLGRDRAQSRDRARSRSRGDSSASAATRPKKPSIVLEIDELMPLPVPSAAPRQSTPKTSKKTLSIAEMRAGSAKRAPPPPPPSQSSSIFTIPSTSPTLSETEPFNPLMMTSVRVHEARASEDVAGNQAGAHPMVAKFSSSASSAAASAGSQSFDSNSSTTSSTMSLSSIGVNLVSSHNGRIFETPTDTTIQRLSDVSSVSSERSTVRPGSLIELKQILEVENVGGKAKEIEI